MTITLTTAAPGDRFEARDGATATYVNPYSPPGWHLLRRKNGTTFRCQTDGRFYVNISSRHDLVRALDAPAPAEPIGDVGQKQVRDFSETQSVGSILKKEFWPEDRAEIPDDAPSDFPRRLTMREMIADAQGFRPNLDTDLPTIRHDSPFERAGLVERLHEWASSAGHSQITSLKRDLMLAAGGIDALLLRATKAEAALDEARKVIAPFGKAAEHWDDIPGVYRCHDNVELWQSTNALAGHLNVGQLRAARDWHSKHGGGGND